MRATVSTAVSDRSVPKDEDATNFWVNKEAAPFMRGARVALNAISRERTTVTTAGDAVWTTIWTSPVMPTNATWTIEGRVVGINASGAAQNAGYGFVGSFASTAGAVAEVVPPALLWSHESAAGLDIGYSVDATNRVITIAVMDDGVSPMAWTGVFDTNEGLAA